MDKRNQKWVEFYCKISDICNPQGALAQLARALAWHARGHRFDSDMLHKSPSIEGLFHFHQLDRLMILSD
jgi:hypothetical protein